MIGYTISVYLKSGQKIKIWTKYEDVRDICINELSEDLGTDKKWIFTLQSNHCIDRTFFINGSNVVAFETKTGILTRVWNRWFKKKGEQNGSQSQ